MSKVAAARTKSARRTAEEIRGTLGRSRSEFILASCRRVLPEISLIKTREFLSGSIWAVFFHVGKTALASIWGQQGCGRGCGRLAGARRAGRVPWHARTRCPSRCAAGVLQAMPGGKRTDRISRRDLEVLEFVARFGVVPRGAVAIWAGTARTVTLERERRLREAGYVEVKVPFGGSERLVLCTTRGLRACGRDELRRPRVSPGLVQHEAMVARMAAQMERTGQHLLSEREILAEERAAGHRNLSAAIGDDRYHRADLITLDEGGRPREAIEVELSTKGAGRLDVLLSGWGEAVAERRLKRVLYRCAPRTRRFVEEAVRRTETTKAVRVEEVGGL